jgi:carboxylesterase type B
MSYSKNLYQRGGSKQNPCYVYDTKEFWHTLADALWLSGVCHADDLGYLFRVGHMDPDLDPESPEAKTRSRLVKMWTNFAKTGYVPLTF